ncbi:DsbA family protein [Microvirga mediterraneensis]|jgi:protein-disulfide isomerase|uniref:DsbA family protein n=1 Tax=Microvirga mediterraneensis TaxID=2754695 RepID=A0A838BVG8_9HYPH|nr:DsbA family protein [Microvirga mediterraneensis]MBA1158873.1 DsbA family protein [Microvirga mediterraneensis]
MIKFRIPILTAAFYSAVILTYPAAAQTAGFTDEQRKAIGEIAREYLLKNPEVLQEMMTELERRNAEAQTRSQAEVLRTEKNTIFNSPSDYVIGNPQGDVTLVEFLDYNCPYCKKAAADVKALITADPKLRVVLKEFPVLGPQSLEASRVALAARQQLKGDRLLEYHTRLMQMRGQVDGAKAKAVAKDMGLDIAQLDKDIESPSGRSVIEANALLADKLGLSGTPAFVIGDQVIAGAVGPEPLRQAIANVRSCGKAQC